MRRVLTFTCIALLQSFGVQYLEAFENLELKRDAGQLRELYQKWLDSDAGKDATKNGYFRESRMGNANIERYWTSYQRLASLKKLNPEANLTMDTPFALMSQSEFQSRMVAPLNNSQFPVTNRTLSSVPSRELSAQGSYYDIDWTTKSGCVAPVRNQHQCGSCWAFAAVDVMQSAYCLKTGRLFSLSEQQLVSCVPNNYGCGGGWVDRAYQWIIQSKKGNICYQKDMPYTASNGVCSNSCSGANIQLKSYVQLQTEQDAYSALLINPLAVYVYANQAWQYYRGGILRPTAGTVNHVVTLVGYNSDNWAWKIKNSWGTNWGVDGYMIHAAGYRGITHPVYPKF